MPDGTVVTAAAVPRWRIDVRVRTMRGKVLIAGPRETLELADTAAYIWRLIDGTRTIQQIAHAVSSEYDVDTRTAFTDATDLITELLNCEVIEFLPVANWGR